jgi:hypothetical protein
VRSLGKVTKRCHKMQPKELVRPERALTAGEPLRYRAPVMCSETSRSVHRCRRVARRMHPNDGCLGTLPARVDFTKAYVS